MGLGTTLHAIAMLGVVVALIAALGWALRRWGGVLGLAAASNTKTPRYKVLSRLPLGPNHTLIELETPQGPTALVLGPQGATMITQPTENHSTTQNPTPSMPAKARTSAPKPKK